MPYDPSGNFTRDYNFTDDRNNGIKVRADRMDGEFDNFATAMNQVILRNGSAAFSGNANMGFNSITNLADGSVGTPAVRFQNSPTTGIYSPGLDKIALTASGTQRLEANTVGVSSVGTFTHTGGMNVSGSFTAGSVAFSGTLNFPTSPGVVQVGGAPVLTMTSGGVLTVTGKTNTSGLYSGGHVFAATGYYVGLSGDGDTRTTLHSLTGTDAYWRVNNLTAVSINSAGEATFSAPATFSAAVKAQAGAYVSGGRLDLAQGWELGLSGSGDTRTQMSSSAGTNFVLRVNNSNRLTIDSAGTATFSDALNVGTDATVAGGIFTGGSTASGSYGAMLRARDSSNQASHNIDSTGAYSILMRPNVSGTNMVTSDYFGVGVSLPLALSGRSIPADFQMMTTGDGQFGNNARFNANNGVTGNIRLDGASTAYHSNFVGGVERSRLVASSASVDFYSRGAIPLNLGVNDTICLTISGAGETYFQSKQSPTNDKAVGYLGIPRSGGAIKTANYTAVLTDAGQHISFNGTSLVGTIPATAAVNYPTGTTLTFVNFSASPLSIGINGGELLYLAGTTSSGTRSLAQNGIATAIKGDNGYWLISGPGLS